MHASFLSKNTLYVLLWDLSRPQPGEDAADVTDEMVRKQCAWATLIRPALRDLWFCWSDRTRMKWRTQLTFRVVWITCDRAFRCTWTATGRRSRQSWSCCPRTHRAVSI